MHQVMKLNLRLNKLCKLFLLIFCLYSNNIVSQNRMTYSDMENILAFNRYITLQQDSLKELKDTNLFIGLLLTYYHDVNKEYSKYIYSINGLNSDIPIIKNDVSSSAVTSSGIVDDEIKFRRKDFTVLYYIEVELLGNNKNHTVIAIKNDKKNGVITGVIDFAKEAHPESYKNDIKHYKWEEKQISKIYKLYKNWFKKIDEYGIDYIRKNNIKPLDGSKYEWSSDTTSTINKNNGEE